MMRTFLAAVAVVLMTAIVLPAIAGPIPSDVDLKAKDGATKLFDTMQENNGGE